MNVVTLYDFQNYRFILRISYDKTDVEISELEWTEYIRVKNEYDKMQKWIEGIRKSEVR